MRNTTWDLGRAGLLLDLLRSLGVTGRPVNDLMRAIAAKSPAIEQRCIAACDLAARDLRDAPEESEWKSGLAAIITDTGGDLADWIQDAVIARADTLGLTAYAIAQRSAGGVSEDHVQAYLTRKKSMGSHKLQHVLRALGLTVTPV